MPNRNINVPILPGQTPWREGAIDTKEFKHLLRIPAKKVFSLDRTHARILFQIVFPYWENYLKAIVHPITDAAILNLKFGWIELLPRCQPPARVAMVTMDSYTSLDLTSEKILFRI